MSTTVKARPITCLSAAQLAGEVCARCHKPASAGKLVPLSPAGLEWMGAYASLRVCWPECEPGRT